jgi:hypothetical protein
MCFTRLTSHGQRHFQSDYDYTGTDQDMTQLHYHHVQKHRLNFPTLCEEIVIYFQNHDASKAHINTASKDARLESFIPPAVNRWGVCSSAIDPFSMLILARMLWIRIVISTPLE